MRPDFTDKPLSVEELAELQRKLKGMSVTAVQDFYHAAHWQCRLDTRLPKARAIHELVAAWKICGTGKSSDSARSL